MNPEVLDLWSRAAQALRTAKDILPIDSDAAASRAYYAAFYAVSAFFAIQGTTFSKHSALEAAVHRNLVKAGHWPSQPGADYTFPRRLRTTGDYGGAIHVSSEDAVEALQVARRILQTVHQAHPEVFSGFGDGRPHDHQR